MKKFIISILTVIYLGTSIGAVLHMHYCMGELADWGIGHNNSKTCAGCGMDKTDEQNNGCCKDEQKFVKNDADQKTVDSYFHLKEVVAVASLPDFIELPLIQIYSVTEEIPVSNAPPRRSGVAVYLLNRTFLI